MPEAERCSKKEWRNGQTWRCARRGTVTAHSTPWCAVHDPIATERRRQEARIRRGSLMRTRDNLLLAQHRATWASGEVVKHATQQVKVENEMHEKLGTPLPETPLVTAVLELELWQGRVKEREAEYLQAKLAVTTQGRSNEELRTYKWKRKEG